jgi:hypothetical protein
MNIDSDLGLFKSILNIFFQPALTLGHIGQLALDAIITTLKLQKVGYIDEPNVLPILSNDAFAADQGVLSTSLEGTMKSIMYYLLIY